MSTRSAVPQLAGVDRPAVIAYGTVFLSVALALTIYLAFSARVQFALALAALPAVLFSITRPRWAVYQYVFCLFISLSIEPGIPVFLADCSALVVIGAAVLDVMLSDRLPRRLPPLSLNFAFLLTAVLLSAAFALHPAAAVRPLARITFLTATFLSLVRLTGSVECRRLLRLFYWLCVIHAVIAAAPYIASGGEERFFGLAGIAYDDLAMIALPIGVAFYLWAESGRAGRYLLGSILILAGLIATQSRASLLLAVLASGFVIIVSLGRAERSGTKAPEADDRPETGDTRGRIWKRTRLLIAVGVAAVLMALILLPDVSSAVAKRFQAVFIVETRNSLLMRLEQWRNAWMVFLHYPVLGAGPGSFPSLYSIFPTLHMQPRFLQIRGLSAHNLILHYLAETGLVGATALGVLFVRQFALARRIWRRPLALGQTEIALALYVAALLFLVTTFLEAGWLWGRFGFPFVFIAALTVRRYGLSKAGG
jgi:O-antigen ligase